MDLMAARTIQTGLGTRLAWTGVTAAAAAAVVY